jgi:glycosyltransferase involved in cell wall biosynthesis
MTQVMTQRPDVQFDIYGNGQSPVTILAHFPERLHSRITVYPRLASQAIAHGLAGAKVFFFPSQYEGFGLALADAMACSCAGVTTPTGFGAELKHGQEVIRCEFDDVDAMTTAIVGLLDDEVWRCQIAKQGWQRVQSLRWDTSVAKLDALYRQWVADHQSDPWSYARF